MRDDRFINSPPLSAKALAQKSAYRPPEKKPSPYFVFTCDSCKKKKNFSGEDLVPAAMICSWCGQPAVKHRYRPEGTR